MTDHTNSAPTPGAAGKPKLLDRVKRCIRDRHYSLRTEEAYVHWIRWYIRYHGIRHPAEMGADESKREIYPTTPWSAVGGRPA